MPLSFCVSSSMIHVIVRKGVGTTALSRSLLGLAEVANKRSLALASQASPRPSPARRGPTHGPRWRPRPPHVANGRSPALPLQV